MLLEAFGFTDVYDYVAGKADWLAQDLPVEEEQKSPPMTGDLTRKTETCRLGEKASVVTNRLKRTDERVSVVVDASNVVLGLVNLEMLAEDPDRDIRELMELGPSTFRPDAKPGEPFDYMERNGVDCVVVTRPDGKLIGIVERSMLEQTVTDDN